MPRSSYTETSRRSWFGRLGGAIKGILVGGLLVLACLIFLFWNEGRAVERARTLEEGGGIVVPVAADRVDRGNEGKLVHVSAMATTDEILTDGEFGVFAPALRLERSVEMYQWEESRQSETKKKLGGGTETTTTYSYGTTWSSRRIDSGGFKVPEGHRNPDSMPYGDRTLSAADVRVGAFRLTPGQVSRVGGKRPLALDSLDLLPTALRGRAQLAAGGIYLGRNPAAPAIGDLRIRYEVVEPTVVSLVARQVGDSFAPFKARAGGTVDLLSTGARSAEEMFAAAQESNRALTWVLRVLGFVLMAAGLRMIFRPLSVFADVVPALGNLAERGTGLLAFFLAALLSFATVGLAWLYYRPLLAFALFTGAAAAVLGIVWLVRRARARAAVAASAAVPPPPPPPPPVA